MPHSTKQDQEPPKADLTAALAEVLDVSPHALSVPDITLCGAHAHPVYPEDNYGLKVQPEWMAKSA